jgi:hypothetical protein
MFGAALFIMAVQYFSEQSMVDLLDIASETSNDEYDFSLPFVLAVEGEDDDEVDIDTTMYFDNLIDNQVYGGDVYKEGEDEPWFSSAYPRDVADDNATVHTSV